MGIPVLIYGKSGSGKSRSLKSFGEEEIFLINVEAKSLPFRGKFKYSLNSDNMCVIKQKLKTMDKVGIRTAVIDDAGYLMTHYFMAHHRDKTGSAQFDMYNDIADDTFKLVKFIKEEIPADAIVYIVMHEETSDYGDTRLKTLGKLLDSKVCLEGMVTICIRCMSDNEHHYFRTKTDGSDITKTPEEMFEADEIDNDLKAVDSAIRAYYEI